MRRTVLALGALVGAVWAATARAQGPRAVDDSSGWVRGPCFGERALRAQVRRLLPSEERLPDDVSVRVTECPDGFCLAVELPGVVRRELAASSCATVESAAAVIVAVAIRERASAAERRAAGPAVAIASEEAPAAGAAVEAPVPRRRLARALSDPAAPPAEGPSWGWGAGAQVLLRALVLPDASVGAALSLLFRYDAWVLRFGGFFLPPSRAALDAHRGAEVELVAGRLSLCGRILQRPFALELCGGGELGALHGRGVGLSHPRVFSTPWGSLTTTVRARLALAGPFGLTSSAGVGWPIDPPRFVVDGRGEVFRPAAMGVHVTLGADFEFE